MSRLSVTLSSLLLAACATTTPAPAPPTTPSSAVVVPPVEPEPVAADAPAPSRPLPRHLMLEDAVSLAVVDVAALRELGIRDSLRLLVREQLGADALSCAEPLIERSTRIVMTRAFRRQGSATAIEQPLEVEPVLDCFAERVPGASAKSIGGRAGLELRDGTIAIDIDGTLVVGNESGLSRLLGIPEPPPPDGELRRGDVLSDEFDAMPIPSDPPGLDALIAQLPRLPGKTLVAAAQNIGEGLSIGGGRVAIRVTDEGLQAHADILGFGGQLDTLNGMPRADQQPMADQVLAALRRSFTHGLDGKEDAAPIVAALERARIERTGPDLRLVVDARDPAPIVDAFERLARKALSDDASAEEAPPGAVLVAPVTGLRARQPPAAASAD